MRHILLALAFLSLALPVCAQEDQSDPSKTARIHIGPLALNPAIQIKDVGIDTNVFNTWVNPQSDFTATLGPTADYWLRIGRTQLSGKADIGYAYFQEFASQRAFNGGVSARYEVNLFHVRPYAIASYDNTRDRPGYEIDIRARHYESTYGLGIDFPMTSRTTFGVLAKRRNTAYAGDAELLGQRLNEQFARRDNVLEGSFRYKMTSLTTLVVKADADRARFTYSADRDSNGFRMQPGVEFSAFAILRGSAYVGFRKLHVLGLDVPDYNGPVASVDLGYTLLGRTRLEGRVDRDV